VRRTDSKVLVSDYVYEYRKYDKTEFWMTEEEYEREKLN
jgi:hypothetical protein